MKSERSFTGLLGRILIGLTFFMVGIIDLVQWQANFKILQAHNFPSTSVSLGIMIGIEILFGFLIIIGKFQRTSAWILILFTLIATPLFLDFWNKTGPEEVIFLIQFISKIAMIGGLLLVSSVANHKNPYG